MWHGVVVNTTVQLNPVKPELTFCTGKTLLVTHKANGWSTILPKQMISSSKLIHMYLNGKEFKTCGKVYKCFAVCYFSTELDNFGFKGVSVIFWVVWSYTPVKNKMISKNKQTKAKKKNQIQYNNVSAL